MEFLYWPKSVSRTVNYNQDFLDDVERLSLNQVDEHQQDGHDSSPEHHDTNADHRQRFDPAACIWASLGRYVPDNHQMSSTRPMNQHNDPQSDHSHARRNAHHHNGNKARYVGTGPSSRMPRPSIPTTDFEPIPQSGPPLVERHQAQLPCGTPRYHDTPPEQNALPGYPQQYNRQPTEFHVPKATTKELSLDVCPTRKRITRPRQTMEQSPIVDVKPILLSTGPCRSLNQRRLTDRR
jgi:hypothetical protein